MTESKRTRFAVALALVVLFVVIPFTAWCDSPRGVSPAEFNRVGKGWTLKHVEKVFDVHGETSFNDTVHDPHKLIKVYSVIPRLHAYVVVHYRTHKGESIYYTTRGYWCTAGAPCVRRW